MPEVNEHIEEDEVDTGEEHAGEEVFESEEDESEEQEQEESEESSEEESSEDEPSVSAKQPSRAETRMAKLVKERNEEREARIRAETLAEERSIVRREPTMDQGTAQRLREEKLALMDPSEKREFLQTEKIESMQNQILLTQLQTQDALDKNTYSAKAARSSVYAKHEGEVEKRLRAERQAGRNWTRETILAQIVGEAALKTKPDTKKKNEARDRVESAKTTPSSSRSNSNAYKPGRSQTESIEDMERRLGNIVF